jgi:putative ABC transport system permease protein
MSTTDTPPAPGARGAVLWLLGRSLKHSPRRTILESLGVAFPVAMIAAILMFVDAAVQSMTVNALRPVEIDMRAVAKTLDVDMVTVAENLARTPGATRVEPFAATNVVVAPGTSGQVTARLFAVDPTYLKTHPWVHLASGAFGKGALLDQSLQSAPGFDNADSVTITLPGDAPEFSLTLPVDGTVDLRQAFSWFAIPYGEVQGDIAVVPRSIVIDYATFAEKILPVLRTWAHNGGLPQFSPGSEELPAAGLEAHIAIDHQSYPPDPGRAELWSRQLQHTLARQAGSPVVVADNAEEPLLEARQDATNAKILFLLLGIPGVLAAGALGLATAGTLVEARRRDDALLRMRGASRGQIVGLATAHAAVAGLGGAVVGLLVAVIGVSAAIGGPVWRDVPASDLAFAAGLAVLVGVLASAVRVIRLRRAVASDIAERRLLDRGWSPLWRRGHLDTVAIALGVAILTVNLLAGGLRPVPVEGPALALSFYVLLAPIALWIGGCLLLIRGLLSLLAMRARPEDARPLSSWSAANLRWLGRRPAQAGRTLAIAALAVAFGTQVLTFAATYQEAKEADARAAIGADLRLTAGNPRLKLPPLGPDVAATTPIRLVPARVDTDRKTILAIDPTTYAATATSAPRIVAGEGLEGLVEDPEGVLIHSEIATEFELAPGDLAPLTIFPDDYENAREMELRVIGVYSAFPPTGVETEVVTTVAALPRAELVPPDFYLGRVAAGRDADTVAEELRTGALSNAFTVATVLPPNARGLTALNLTGLSLITAIGAGLVAAVGTAILGAFLILERRREFAVLRAIGADAGQMLAGPVLEGTLVAVGSLVIGTTVGLGLGALSVRVLALFFALSPPLLTVPIGQLIGLALLVLIASAIALGAAVAAVHRIPAAAILREP